MSVDICYCLLFAQCFYAIILMDRENLTVYDVERLLHSYCKVDYSSDTSLSDELITQSQKSICNEDPVEVGYVNTDKEILQSDNEDELVKQSSVRRPSSHHKRKRTEKKVEVQEPSDSDDDIPLFCLEEQAEETENKSVKEKSKRNYNRTRSTSSSRSKSKSTAPPQTAEKLPPPVVKKKRRSKRKR